MIGKNKSSKNEVFYICNCDCGNNNLVKKGRHVLRGHTKSCGCLSVEAQRSIGQRCSQKKYEPMITSALTIYRARYRESGLSFEDFLEISQKNCFYCGIEPKQEYNLFMDARNLQCSSQDAITNGTFTYNGLDRVDPNLGHTKENCVPCCKHCNYAKRAMSIEEFKVWLIRAYNHFIGHQNIPIVQVR